MAAVATDEDTVVLSPAESTVLDVIRDQHGAIHHFGGLVTKIVAHLAQAMGSEITQPTVSGVLRSLEDKGQIIRVVSDPHKATYAIALIDVDDWMEKGTVWTDEDVATLTGRAQPNRPGGEQFAEYLIQRINEEITDTQTEEDDPLFTVDNDNDLPSFNEIFHTLQRRIERDKTEREAAEAHVNELQNELEEANTLIEQLNTQLAAVREALGVNPEDYTSAS